MRIAVAVLALLTCAVVATASARGRPAIDERELRHLLDVRDVFALRDRIDRLGEFDSASLAFYRATVASAFNDVRSSNRALVELLARTHTPPGVRVQALGLLRTNDARLADYRGALAAARQLLALPPGLVAATDRDDAQDQAALFRALVDVPPQQARVAADAVVKSRAASLGRCVPLTIDGQPRCFAMDTGANFSILMRSQARALGLTIRHAGVAVRSSTDAIVVADVAVADRLTIGPVQYRHVPFLVVADSLLTFPGGASIPGLIGLPVIAAMGQVAVDDDGSLRISRPPSEGAVGNIAFDGLHLIAQIGYRGADVVCRVDNGAPRTTMYEPFFLRFRDTIEQVGRAVVVRTGGVGGMRAIRAFRVPSFDLRLTGRSVTVPDVDVYTRPLAAPGANYLFCNVGRDTLAQGSGYQLNFDAMSLTLQ